MPQFNCLYYFQSESFALIEVKKLELPEEASPTQVYSWLLINFQTKAIRKLHFKSMNKTDCEEEREFEEGKFTFNETEGRLHLVAGAFTLKRTSPKELPLSLYEAIENFI